METEEIRKMAEALGNEAVRSAHGGSHVTRDTEGRAYVVRMSADLIRVPEADQPIRHHLGAVRFTTASGIEVRYRLDPTGGASLSTNLAEEIGPAAGEALESFLLALAADGVDLSHPRIQGALSTATEAVANRD